MKGGIIYSNAITTVSPTYAQEALHAGAAGWLRSTLTLPDVKAKFYVRGVGGVFDVGGVCVRGVCMGWEIPVCGGELKECCCVCCSVFCSVFCSVCCWRGCCRMHMYTRIHVHTPHNAQPPPLSFPSPLVKNHRDSSTGLTPSCGTPPTMTSSPQPTAPHTCMVSSCASATCSWGWGWMFPQIDHWLHVSHDWCRKRAFT